MEDHTFWTRTWRSFDPGRIPPYLAHLSRSADPLIDLLKERELRYVCDAGCGCGAYSLKLARHGFTVAGFDIAKDAVSLAAKLFAENGYPSSAFKTADLLSTGYADGVFDAVAARDVLDHLPLKEGIAAVKELERITRPGGCVLLTLDAADEEYESEPHSVNEDGDYLFPEGKWAGMVFHPYSLREVDRLADGLDHTVLPLAGGGILAVFEKRS
ncbi:MAG: class I SAM-dependent methyltransferase [Clostridia bacterium]|nr:class I SAM-dependent methyltransferase [Clostridia bacterium]